MLVGPGHEVRVALGENGILIPVEKVEKGPKPNDPQTPRAIQVGRRFYEFLSEDHPQREFAEEIHYFVGQ